MASCVTFIIQSLRFPDDEIHDAISVGRRERSACVVRVGDDVREGLTAANKRLSCRYFYDAAGSALFEEICELPEYYLTRAEQEILDAHAGEIVASCSGDAAPMGSNAWAAR